MSPARGCTGVGRALWQALAAALLLSLALGAVIAQSPPDDAGGEDAAAVDIAAASLTVDTGARSARFSGGVVVRRGDWVLRCPSLEARYDAQGELERAEAKGPVELAGPQFWAEAQAARYERGASGGQVLHLSGEPTVRRGQSTLRAEAVEVDLESGQVSMRGVRGRLVVPRSE